MVLSVRCSNLEPTMPYLMLGLEFHVLAATNGHSHGGPVCWPVALSFLCSHVHAIIQLLHCMFCLCFRKLRGTQKSKERQAMMLVELRQGKNH